MMSIRLVLHPVVKMSAIAARRRRPAGGTARRVVGWGWDLMELKRTTVRDLRRHNRSTLLSKLFFDGPLSRHELSQLTGLSAATVSNVTGELVEDRLIIEAGLVESDGGRPRVLLRVDPNFGNVIGIDVGETGVKVELFDLAMNRLAAVEHPLP